MQTTKNAFPRIEDGSEKCLCLHCKKIKPIAMIKIAVEGASKHLDGPANCCRKCLEENSFILDRTITSQAGNYLF